MTRAKRGHHESAANEATVRNPSSLAKITAPTVRRALNRDAVFALLDDCADRRLIWLSAPAGYGKTTAIVTYLRARQIIPVWYRCDEGDADIASFFYYLGLALRTGMPEQAAAIPDPSAENLTEIPSFARNFCRQWFSLLPKGTVWVLDDWQNVPATSPLLDLLPVIVEEIPEGVQLVVISRAAPAANMSRLVAGQDTAVLAEQDLRLTRQETGAIAAQYEHPTDPTRVTTADELYALTDGWAAGLTALLRHDAKTPLSGESARHESLRRVFNFLSTEVFGRLDADSRDLLLKTACLEYVSVPVAEQISGRENARDILNSLVDRNAFTTYRPASDTYHQHPLLREFLRDRLNATIDEAGRRDLQIAAAQGLARGGRTEQAIPLLLQAGDWQSAALLIVEAAPAMIRQARFEGLCAWISRLPAAVRAGNAWIAYWHGVAQTVIDGAAARDSLERAYALFDEASDPLGRMLAASALLQLIGPLVESSSMLPWIERLVALLEPEPSFPSPTVELQVMTGLLLSLSQAQPTHPVVPFCVTRVMSLIDEREVDPASNASGVAALLHFFGMCGRMARYRAFADRVESLSRRTELGPGARIQILWTEAQQRFLRGCADESQGLLDSAQAMAREHGLCEWQVRIRISRLQMQDIHGRGDELAAAFDELEPALTRVPPMVAAHARYLRAMYLLAIGESAGAQRLMGETARLCCGPGWSFLGCMIHIGMAEILVEQQRYGEAEQMLLGCDPLLDAIDAPVLRFSAGLVRAELARHARPRPEFAALLAEVFAIGREQGFANTFHAYGLLLPRLIPYALGSGVEVPYCRSVILQRKLVPPLADVPHWPWAVRIRAMGHLEIVVDGAAIEFSGKAQRKPIELLKALLTRSAGIDTVRLMDALWPDLDGDAARNAFDLSVHRLRKLLKHKEAVRLSQGRLCFNPRLVWVDAFVLERLSAEGFAETHLVAGVSDLLALYRGALLADEEGSAVSTARRRLCSQFVRCVEALVDRLGKAGQWELAESLCRRAVEVEPLVEGLYRTWMHSLRAQGHFAEAEAVFRSREQRLWTGKSWSTGSARAASQGR
jgi:DNA-binding SARP family transcriptional activator